GEASTPRVGSIVQGVEGILERRHGSWRIQVEQPLQLQAAERPQPPRVPGTLKVAAFNLENLFNGDGRGGGFPTKRGARTHAAMQAQLAKLVATVHGLDPDIAALMELENDGYGPESSLAQLVDALNADGAQWRFVDAGHGAGRGARRGPGARGGRRGPGAARAGERGAGGGRGGGGRPGPPRRAAGAPRRGGAGRGGGRPGGGGGGDPSAPGGTRVGGR